MQVSWRRAAVGIAFIALGVGAGTLALGQWTAPPKIAPSIADSSSSPSASPSPASTTPPPESRSAQSQPASAAITVRTFAVAGLGRVNVYTAAPPVEHTVLLISAEGGIKPDDTDRATRLATKATAVAMLSFDVLKRAQGTVRCWFPAGVLEEVAKTIETRLDLPVYHAPALVGVGAGSALVFASLAQAPDGTFAGGVGVTYTGTLPTNRPLCGTKEWKPTFNASAHVATLPAIAHPTFEWRESGASASSEAQLGDDVNALLGAATPSREKPAVVPASAADLERRLAALKLSLDDTWAEHPKASLIFMSGDGGWRDIDRHLAAYLAPRGVNVIGLSSLAYLWKPKTPQQGGVDLQRIADIVAQANVPIFAGGYSMGAEVMPFFLDAWPAEDRRKIAGQVLIAPGSTATFSISLSNMDWNPFHSDTQTAYRVADAVRRDGLPAFCLTGTTVAPANTACSAIGDIATVAKLPGDHHFNANYDAVGAAVLGFLLQTR